MAAIESLQNLIQSVAKANLSQTATLAQQIDAPRNAVFTALGASPEAAKLSKAAALDVNEVLADVATVLGLTSAILSHVVATSKAQWQADPCGQARAHEYVDQWGRRKSAEVLLEALLTPSNAALPATQLKARLEAVTTATREAFLSSVQALVKAGEVELVSGVVPAVSSKFNSPSWQGLTGSILKELHWHV